VVRISGDPWESSGISGDNRILVTPRGVNRILGDTEISGWCWGSLGIPGEQWDPSGQWDAWKMPGRQWDPRGHWDPRVVLRISGDPWESSGISGDNGILGRSRGVNGIPWDTGILGWCWGSLGIPGEQWDLGGQWDPGVVVRISGDPWESSGISGDNGILGRPQGVNGIPGDTGILGWCWGFLGIPGEQWDLGDTEILGWV